ncbi:transcriptional regulator [Nostoc sp.]
MIKRQYFERLNITITDFADIINVSPKTGSEIVNEQVSVTPGLAHLKAY